MSLKKGFAKMDPEKIREIARLGGIAAQKKGTGHSWQKGSNEPVIAGRLGGANSRGGGRPKR